MVMVSESGPDRLRVSWFPVGSGRIERYRVEFGPIPRGDVRAVALSASLSSVLLTQLQPDTHYLITINAIHSSGQERAISVKACTQEGERVTPTGAVDFLKVPIHLVTKKHENSQ